MLAASALADIQGFITTGYGHLPQAAYVPVQFADRTRAQQWIAEVVPTLTSSSRWTTPPPSAVNVALTFDGLRALGLAPAALCTFPPEFQEGIATPERSAILGDTEESDPARWEIGGPSRPAVHALLLVHGRGPMELEHALAAQRELIARAAGGVTEIAADVQRGFTPESRTEPFGFYDGVAQPSIRGIPKKPDDAGVPTGEFILGYENHYQVIPPTPVIGSEVAGSDVLPALDSPYHAPGRFRDLGANGSFVVYRKLAQDVAGFWDFMRREAARLTGRDDAADARWLAARCVGRWPSGAPLVLSPDRDDPTLADRDDFGYAGDPDGLACPLGAHIRRCHPRDKLRPYPVEQSLSMSEAHRLLRRARVFAEERSPRGIHFFCVNASIRSQFEFVQQTWCNNPRFAGLSDNKDPIVGDNDRNGQPPTRMSIPGKPAGIRTSSLPRFVTVKGGAYLFMPSMTALRFLAAFGEDLGRQNAKDAKALRRRDAKTPSR